MNIVFLSLGDHIKGVMKYGNQCGVIVEGKITDINQESEQVTIMCDDRPIIVSIHGIIEHLRL